MTVKITTNEEDKENSQRKNWALIDTIVNLRPCLIKVHCLAIAACARWYANASGNPLLGEQFYERMD